MKELIEQIVGAIQGLLNSGDTGAWILLMIFVATLVVGVVALVNQHTVIARLKAAAKAMEDHLNVVNANIKTVDTAVQAVNLNINAVNAKMNERKLEMDENREPQEACSGGPVASPDIRISWAGAAQMITVDTITQLILSPTS